jgi:hypothetical protein
MAFGAVKFEINYLVAGFSLKLSWYKSPADGIMGQKILAG